MVLVDFDRKFIGCSEHVQSIIDLDGLSQVEVIGVGCIVSPQIVSVQIQLVNPEVHDEHKWAKELVAGLTSTYAFDVVPAIKLLHGAHLL